MTIAVLKYGGVFFLRSREVTSEGICKFEIGPISAWFPNDRGAV